MSKYIADLRLVEQMLAGEEQAFEMFGESCFRAVYRFTLARLEGDRELAQEITQTAMSKALGKLETYRGEAALVTWLCSCCRNEILMYFRRRRSEPAIVELDDPLETTVLPATASTNAETAFLRREEALLVHMALDTLPEHYARALEWMYIERLPVREIAQRMGVQPKAVESLLTRARHAFRKSYESGCTGMSGLRDGPRWKAT